ncbi:MAG: hypothetical protein C0501_28880 [Isosphaera sp.]|nr:hypothetical protein [Isosphaera sp.]
MRTLVVAATLWVPASPAVAKPPNVLFVLADDMGWQDSSVPFTPEPGPQNKVFRTPALEWLAREGMTFPQAYSCAVCSPTRVTLMTGQNEARHGVTQWTYLGGDKPPSDLPHPTLRMLVWAFNGLQPEPGMPHSVTAATLPALFNAAGYRTMHFGKGHFGAAGTPGADPKAFGFDVRIGGRDAVGIGSYSGLHDFAAQANPIHVQDWLPTLLEAAGPRAPADAAAKFNGQSLVPLLKGEPPKAFNCPLIWHFPNSWGPLSGKGPGLGPCSAIRDGNWKLIYPLADREPDTRKRLAATLTDYLRSRNAPMPVFAATGKAVPWPDGSTP